MCRLTRVSGRHAARQPTALGVAPRHDLGYFVRDRRIVVQQLANGRLVDDEDDSVRGGAPGRAAGFAGQERPLCYSLDEG